MAWKLAQELPGLLASSLSLAFPSAQQFLPPRVAIRIKRDNPSQKDHSSGPQFGQESLDIFDSPKLSRAPGTFEGID